MPGILKQDPETGFLCAPGYKHCLTIQQKQTLLNLVQNNPHHSGIIEACKIVGIHTDTFYRHLRLDLKFQALLDEMKKNCAYAVENTLYQCALDPKKTLDRLAYLRAFMPERYNPGANTSQNGTVTINIEILDSARDHQRIVADAVTRIDESEVVDVQGLPSHESLPSQNIVPTVDDAEHNDNYRKLGKT